MKFICGAITEQCSNRMHINQDKFGAVRTLNADDREIILALVCDGVSIAYHSEYASYHTVLRLLRWAEQYFPNTNGFDIQNIAEEIDNELRHCNNLLINFAEKHSDEYDCCCTVSGIVTDGNEMLFFNAGDSRVYEFDILNKKISCLTRDNKGEDGFTISMCIGGVNDQDLNITYSTDKYHSQSVYMVCTDGMYSCCDFGDWADDLKNSRSKQEIINILRQMLKSVRNDGETDDVTAIAVVSHI